MATPETASETTALPASTIFSEEYYPFLLSPFGLFGFFFFSLIFALHLLSHIHSLVLYHKKAATLYFLFPAIQAPVRTQVYRHSWFPVSVLHAPLSLLPSTYKNLASCFANLNKHWALSTAAREALSPVDLCLPVVKPTFISKPVFHWRLLLSMELEFHADSRVNLEAIIRENSCYSLLSS